MQAALFFSELDENQAKGFEYQGRKLFAVRFRDELFIYENSCPHRSIPLEWQPDQFLDYEKTFIQCATHGALFKIDSGECVAGPCVGDTLQQIPFRIEGDQVFIEEVEPA